MGPKTARLEFLMRALGLILIAAAAFLIIFYAVTVPVERTYGERYVDAEIPVIFPFYVIASFKPITLIVYFLFGAMVLMLEAYKEHLRKFDTRGLRILLVFIAFASAYEVLWNLLAWFTIWQRTGGPLDMLANTTHSYFQLPVNFNFATKVVFLVFATSLYATCFLANIELPDQHPTREKSK